MAIRIVAFALGGWFCHQLAELPDPLYAGLAPLLLPLLTVGDRRRGLLAALLLGVGWTAFDAQQGLYARLPEALQGRDLLVSGRVADLPLHAAERIRLILAVDSVTGVPPAAGWNWAGCRLRLTWYRPDDGVVVRAGEHWQAVVRLRIPRGSRNHGGFDAEHRALREGVCATGYLRTRTPPRRVAAAAAGLQPLREHLAARLAAHVDGLPAAGLTRALAVGLRDRVSAEQRWLMQHTGTAHLMAISGLHVGLAAGLGLALARVVVLLLPGLAMLLPAGHWGALAALAAAAVYAALAGFSIPTQRALFMLAAYLCATLARRRCRRSHTLLIALGALLALDPLAVFDPATWLSFAAVAGLLWALPPGPVREQLPVLGWVLRMGRLQLVACAVVAPLAVLCFAYQSVNAPLANLLAVPVTGLAVVPAILAGLFLDAVSPAAAGLLLRFATHVLGILMEALAALPGQGLALAPAAPPSATALLCALIGIALLVSVAAPRIRALGLVWLLPLLNPAPAGPGPGELQVQVLDVGQGLAVVVRTRSRVLVFDAGPSWSGGHDAGASIVAPALRRNGVEGVDVLLVSHRHSDHAGGAPGLARSMPVSRVLGSAMLPRRRAQPCRAGGTWHWDGYRFRILNPAGGGRGDNNDSCALHVSGPGGSVLLPADVERAAETAILARATRSLAADVLLVPHHGSRTSSTPAFLDAVAPRIAINSSGHRNRFRLPSATVVDRYHQRGIRFLDTACLGEVGALLAPGRVPRVRTWREHGLRFWHDRSAGAHCDR